MANERTFLAWIRTSIGIMAFGFVVERFAIFVRQVSYFLGRTPQAGEPPAQAYQSTGYSSVLGVVLIGLGALMGLLAFVRYKKVEKQIDEDTYQASLILDVLVTLTVVSVGIFLVIYLNHML
jgi:putative membrane protein